MALAFRAAASTGTGSAANNITVSVPTVVDDDIMLLCCVNSDSSDPADFNDPSGWTTPRLVNNLQVGGSAPSAPGMSVWRRIASSEPASYNITTNPTASNGLIGFILTFSGGDTTTPIDVTTTTATGDGSNADPPSITPVTDGALTVIGSWHDSTTAVGTGVPSGYTDSGQSRVTGTGGGNGCTAQIAYRSSVIDPAAAENPGAFTTSSEQWGAFTIALRPAPLGITGVTPSEFDMDEADVDVESSGNAFDSSGNDVYLSDANTLAGSANEVDISSAINTEAVGLINLDFTQLSAGELASLHTLGPGARFIIVDTVGNGELLGFAVTLHRPHAFQMSLSASFAPSGTTARLTAPSGKTTGDMDGGRIEEALNPSTTNTTVTEDDYREDVACMKGLTNAREVQYRYRVLYSDNVVDTTSVIPKMTITATPGGATQPGWYQSRGGWW